MLALGGVIVVVFAVLLVRGLFRRGSSEGAGEDVARQRPTATGLRWIFVGGVAGPTIVLIALMWLTLAAMKVVSPIPPADAVTIEVIGHQWWWEVNYPDHQVTTANEIHIPVGVPVELILRSDDVIHSFWVPALHGKLDALPDYPTTLVLHADQAGQYRGACAEFCGLQHAKMGLLVVATPLEQFEAWVVGQQQPAPAPSGAAQQGLEVFLSSECVDCHTIRGTGAIAGIGPDLTHLADRMTIGAGTLPNETEYLAAWIRDPHASKEGVEMPAAELSDDDLEALLLYLASLR
jgi:cytochrome c oxidase subunit II